VGGLVAVVVVGVLVGGLTAGGLAVDLLTTDRLGSSDARQGHGEDDAPVASDASTGEAAAERASAGYAVWERRDDGSPVRWDPCRPIEVVVSTVGAPASVPPDAFLDDVQAAVDDLRAATGLGIEVRGTSDQRPDAARSTVIEDGDGQVRWAPVLIGWRTPGSAGLPLRDSDRAVAIPLAAGREGHRVYVTGQVALNGDRGDLRPGRVDRATAWGATILHELSHVLGLAHVDDPDQLLHVFPGDGPVELGHGDLAGLGAVGDDGDCLDVPPPREMTVDIPDR
jgi:hypothetical protein